MNPIRKELFGMLQESSSPGLSVYLFTLSNQHGMSVKVMNYGATVTSICVNDVKGHSKDIALGFDSLDGYLGKHGENPYLGATVGRVGDRIRAGQFVLNGDTYQLDINNGPNHLHGGVHGFDKKFWEVAEIDETSQRSRIVFEYKSLNGDQGYPGDLATRVIYEVTNANELKISYRATTTAPTPISLTNHSYFNLEGHEEGNGKLKHHSIEINADYYTPLDEDLVPTGNLESVGNSVYDFRKPKKLDQLLQTFPAGPNGYDINFCINPSEDLTSDLKFVAGVTGSNSGIGMKVYSTQPGVQLYTANFFPDGDREETPIRGKGGAQYLKHGAFCLETQNFPNAVNEANFPNTVLNPGETYDHTTVFQFYTSHSPAGVVCSK